MAAVELQFEADASENDASDRYIRRQRLAVFLADAVRQADAMLRLEASLRNSVRQTAA